MGINILAPFKLTKCTKLRWFQTCINHKILVTNKLLYQMKIIDNPTCSLCGNNEESIEPLFWKCPNTQQFLNKVKDKFQEISVSLSLDECKFISGINPPKHIRHYQVLMFVLHHFMSWCLNFFVLLAPYVWFHIFS